MIFSFIFLFSAFFIILTPNAIYSILFLLLIFINSTIFLFYMYFDFIAFLLLIVYIGAIVVLLLGLIMLVYNSKVSSTLYAFLLSFLLSIFLLLFTYIYNFNSPLYNTSFINYSHLTYLSFSHSIHLIANALFNNSYSFLLLFISIILFLAMVGTILLTISSNSYIKKQYLFSQLFRNIINNK